MALAVAACGGQESTSSGSPSPTTVASASPSVSISPSPSGSPATTVADPKLTCTKLPVARDPLILMSTAIGLYVVDVADPLRPAQACLLANARSGRFISPSKIAFWYSTFVGTADLETGNLFWNRAFLDEPLAVVFSPDGSSWAWREGDAAGIKTHLVAAGKDEVLVTRGLLGGYSVPPYGPLDELAFSASGQYLLTYAFQVAGGEPPNFMVFAMDGSTVFKSTTAKFGTWDRAGNRLYFLAATTLVGIGGTVNSLDPGGQPVVRSAKVSSFFWPSLSPDGRALVFNTYGAQIFPHPWRLDIAKRAKTQLSSSTSTHPVFVAPDVIWSNEGIPCTCGLGGTSAPDGRVIAHNLKTGVNSVVLEISNLTPSKSPTADIVDIWFG